MKMQKLNGYTLITYKDLTLRNGVLVQGLPGIGLVGKIACRLHSLQLKLGEGG
jgi:proteasome assembly chaperone (PAC2) family protein